MWGMGLFLLLLIALGIVLFHKLDESPTSFARLNEGGLEPFIRGQSPEDETQATRPPALDQHEGPAWGGARQEDAFRAPQTPFVRPEARKKLQAAGDPFAGTASAHSDDDSVPRQLFEAESPVSAGQPARASRTVPTLTLTDDRSVGGSGAATVPRTNPFAANQPPRMTQTSGSGGLTQVQETRSSDEHDPFHGQQTPQRPLAVSAQWEERSPSSPTQANIRRVSAEENEPQPTLAIEPEPFELSPVPAKASSTRPPADELTTPIPIPKQDAVAPAIPEQPPFGAFDSPAPTAREKERTPAPTAPLFIEDERPTDKTPPPSTGFEFDRPAAAVRSRSNESSPARPPHPEIAEEQLHEVQPGENYWTISRQHYGAGRYFGALAEYNRHRIPSPERMKPGMIVLIPDARVLYERYPSLTNGPPEGVQDPEAAERNRFGFFLDENGQPMYRVGAGDTLGEIAQKHLGRSSRWVQIHGMNRDQLSDAGTLKIGTVLRLPRDASQVMLAPDDALVR